MDLTAHRPRCPACGHDHYTVEHATQHGKIVYQCRSCEHVWHKSDRVVHKHGILDLWDVNPHQDLTLDHPRAKVVRCPKCGQHEVWHLHEIRDHGYCRHTQQGRCPKCGHYPTNRGPNPPGEPTP